MKKSILSPVDFPINKKALIKPEYTILAAIAAAKKDDLSELELAHSISDVLYDIMICNEVSIEIDMSDGSLAFRSFREQSINR